MPLSRALQYGKRALTSPAVKEGATAMAVAGVTTYTSLYLAKLMKLTPDEIDRAAIVAEALSLSK